MKTLLTAGLLALLPCVSAAQDNPQMRLSDPLDFPGEGYCIDVPGAPVILRPCGGRESFLNAGELQKFERTTENQLRLVGTDLCLTAGPDAARTFSASDRWRTLTMEKCLGAPSALSVWAD